MNLNFLLAIIGTISCLIYLGIYVLLHILPTKYNPVNNAVSDYGIGRTKRIFNFYLIFSFIAIAIVWIEIRNNNLPLWVSAAFILMLSGRTLVFIFPTNLEGQKINAITALHYVGATFSFAGAYICMTNLFFVGLTNFKFVQEILNIINFAAKPALVLLGASLLIKPFRKIFGLSERIYLTLFGIWLLIINILLAYSFLH